MLPFSAAAQLLASAKVYVTESVQSLPAMTSNTAPAGHVVSYGGGGGEPAWKAFDQNYVNLFNSTTVDSGGGLANFLTRQHPAPIRVGAYQILSSMSGNLTLEGSNNGSTWFTLDARTVSNPNPIQTYTVLQANRAFYSYHRLTFTDSSNARVSELALLQDL